MFTVRLAYSVLDHELNVCHSIFTPVTCLLRTTFYLHDNLQFGSGTLLYVLLSSYRAETLLSAQVLAPSHRPQHCWPVVAEKDRWVGWLGAADITDGAYRHKQCRSFGHSGSHY